MKNFIYRISELKWWQLLLAFIISLFLSAFLLRSNNLTMVELVNNVVYVDEESDGDIEEIEPVLLDLANYVGSHMNTTMEAPVQLQYRYNRVINDLVSANDAENEAYRNSVYQRAQDECQSVQLSVRVPCVQEYVAAQPGVEPLKLPPVEQFSYIYASPRWSPDLAGFAVLLSVLLGFATTYVFITDYGLPKLISTVRDDPLE